MFNASCNLHIPNDPEFSGMDSGSPGITIVAASPFKWPDSNHIDWRQARKVSKNAGTVYFIEVESYLEFVQKMKKMGRHLQREDER